MTRSRTPRSDLPGTTRVLAGAGLVILLGGLVAIVISSRGDGGAEPQSVPAATAATATTPSPTPPRPKSVQVAVEGIGAYDPEGDRSENDGDAGLATDGILSTAWASERYRSSFAKTGVGLVVDAGRQVKPNRVVVATETPGYTAEVRVGSSPSGPFVRVSKEQVTKTRTTFVLQPRKARYVIVWITSMPEEGAAAVNEITVRAAS